MCWRSSCRAIRKTRLKFKGCSGSALNGLLSQGTKRKMLFMNLWSILKEHSKIVKEHNRSVSSNWPPLLPSRGQMFVKATRTNPAALLLRVVYLHTVVQPWIKAQTLAIFSIYFVPYAHCILYILSLSETCYVPLLLTETSECLCTVIPTVVLLCCTRAWWEPGEADLSSALFEDLSKNTAFKRVLSINKVIVHYSNNTVVHWRKDILWNSL